MPIGPLAARVTRNQVGLVRALPWALRPRTRLRPGDVALPYNGVDRAVIWTITVIGVLETVIVHVLVSWAPLRWPLVVLSVYGLLALLALDATMRRHPHLLRDGELLLRSGHFRTVRVPLDHLAGVRKHVLDTHRRTLETEGGGLALAFMGGTNVELRFSPTAAVEVDGGTHVVERVSFSAADPAAAVSLLRSRTTSADR